MVKRIGFGVLLNIGIKVWTKMGFLRTFFFLELEDKVKIFVDMNSFRWGKRSNVRI